MNAKIIGRSAMGEALMPDAVISGVLKDAAKQSVMLTRAKQVRMSTKKAKQAVLSSLPDAYWVDGDTGMKQTTEAGWKDVVITAEELATIVPIPDAVIDDADIPLWDEVQPLIAESIGKKVDQAAIFGVDKPSSWAEGLIPAATAAGNVVQQAAGTDIGVAVAQLGQKLAGQGFSINGFACAPGLQWELVGARNADGLPIYTTTLAGSTPTGLYGFPLNEVSNGAWNATSAKLLAADWSKVVVGIRQDITYELFKEGVVSDSDGKVLVNLMQQDMKALRVVMRIGYQVANPVTALQATESKRFPAGIITPAAG